MESGHTIWHQGHLVNAAAAVSSVDRGRRRSPVSYTSGRAGFVGIPKCGEL